MSERHPNDSCRICRTSFKVKFGNIPGKQVYSSSENLFKPSQRKDSPGVVLAEVCSRVGLVFLHDPVIYSDRVCNPCGRKIRSLGQLFEFVKAGTTPLKARSEHWQLRRKRALRGENQKLLELIRQQPRPYRRNQLANQENLSHLVLYQFLLLKRRMKC